MQMKIQQVIKLFRKHLLKYLIQLYSIKVNQCQGANIVSSDLKNTK